ncbi:hypothetical protein [Alistipes putredinis]|uniref:hypothetical protein n=1 Tax=Alistipes putredinis TaxID=28117 RepID=UPI003AB3BC41
MQVKLLRQAAGRDDRIVAAYEDVTFLNEHVGWYLIIKDRFREEDDIVVVVLRVGDVCFSAGSMFRRGMLRKEYIEARTAEARNLRAAVQRRMESRQWIPSSYVAAYEALGWDARPLKGHRARMRELYAAEDRRREQVRIEREKRRQRQEEARLRTSLKRAEAIFRDGGFVETELFIALCGKYGINIHPRTLGMLQKRIADLSRTQIHCKGVSRGIRTPSLRGCRELIDRLAEKLK